MHKVSIRNKIVLHKVNLWLTRSSPCIISSFKSYCTTQTWDRLRHERRHHPAWAWWQHRRSVVPGSVGQGCSRGCGSRGHPRRSCCQGTSWSKEVELLVPTSPYFIRSLSQPSFLLGNITLEYYFNSNLLLFKNVYTDTHVFIIFMKWL